jgi:hypothetical protein
MWQRIRNWLAQFNVSAKSLACLWAAASFLYVENKRFHDAVFNLFSRFPHFMQEFVVGVIIPLVLLLGHWRKKKAESNDAVQLNRTSEDQGL